MGKEYQIGVIVGRFQVHKLHEAHQYIIDQVINNHKKIILFLGVAKVVGTKKNPLDFDSRKKMIQEKYPNIVILPLPDFADDRKWSKEIDMRIREIYATGEVLLYGGRDSFIPYYKNNGGNFDTKELEQHTFVSGSEVRKLVSNEIKNSSNFRAGMIYQSYNQYPKVHPIVSIAIMDNDKILLAKKSDEKDWRFLGGFVKPSDHSYETAANRKISEDVGIDLNTSELTYIGSAKIPDWRYQSEEDKIITILYKTNKYWGRIEPSGDISILKWFNISELSTINFVNEHEIIKDMLIKNLVN